jgi:stress-induced morphogen
MEVQRRIEDALRQRLRLSALEISNESSRHNHSARAETHFKLTIVSAAFEGKAPVERHRLVYDALGDELRRGLHAVTITARTPEEWQARPETTVSPPCLGGSRL